MLFVCSIYIYHFVLLWFIFVYSFSCLFVRGKEQKQISIIYSWSSYHMRKWNEWWWWWCWNRACYMHAIIPFAYFVCGMVFIYTMSYLANWNVCSKCLAVWLFACLPLCLHVFYRCDVTHNFGLNHHPLKWQTTQQLQQQQLKVQLV